MIWVNKLLQKQEHAQQMEPGMEVLKVTALNFHHQIHVDIAN